MMQFDAVDATPAQLIKCADAMCEYLEQSVVFLNPYEQNWKIANCYLLKVRAYSAPSTWMLPNASWPLAKLRFKRMKKAIPILDNFYRDAHDHTNYAEYDKLLDLLLRVSKHGMGMLRDFSEPPKTVMAFIEEVFPITRRGYNLAKTLFGDHLKRSYHA